MNLQHLKIDRDWTLFLDRDGVINRRIVGDYVKTWDQLGFLPGVPEAITRFGNIFGRIIVVTNQQGVGKGLMTEMDVHDIHARMIREINLQDGRIDAMYFAPHLRTAGSVMRKPRIGMALKARREFPEIRFKQSLMVGDSITDMIFGKRIGMQTVMIAPDNLSAKQHPDLIDFVYPDLLSLSHDLKFSR